ncbi:MAG: phosphate ABC transporter permease PstA [Planctomycetota bacterium]|nr:MAG: phosphate ABC transporter permease PstA [Planctomycetota bacterium]
MSNQASPQPGSKKPTRNRQRVLGSGPSFFAQGEPMVWLTGGCLAICLIMIVSMLVYVVRMGTSTFLVSPIVEVTTLTGETYMGEPTREQTFRPGEHIFNAIPEEHQQRIRDDIEAAYGYANRRLLRTGNAELTGNYFTWVTDIMVAEERTPEWAVVLERLEWGRFYGIPTAFTIDGEEVASGPAEAWAMFRRYHPEVRARYWQRQDGEKRDIGRINRGQEQSRLRLQRQRLEHRRGTINDAQLAAAEERFEREQEEFNLQYEKVMEPLRALNAENARYQLILTTADGQTKHQPMGEIVRGYAANQMGFFASVGIYGSRWWEFIFHDPREANMEGGVWPAIVGTVIMTLIMTVLVVPIGVLAALYLREYAKTGPVVSAVRIAINNLAGVPSIVFGVFGLGFFCYIVGGGIDAFFYPERSTPVFAGGGVLWASATLALLTLPVVIVATEEALAAVPGSSRQGSYACGASKWQTIRRIVLPRAMPGIMTGMILAMARGAGEVAPLMLVGAVKLAPDLPVDFSNWSGSLGWIPTGPIHMERSFMHLGFHIYDVGFQSSDSEAARPMVFTTTMLLISIVVVLNLLAMYLRARLKRRFAGAMF